MSQAADAAQWMWLNRRVSAQWVIDSIDHLVRIRDIAKAYDERHSVTPLAAALAREAALREEVAKLKEAARIAGEVGAPNFHAMKRRLTAAEQRNADIKQFLAELISEAGYDWLSSEAVAKMKEFLKPTESVASE